MPGWIELRVNVIKNGMEKYHIKKNPTFKPGPLLPNYNDYIVFEGISVNEFTGEQNIMMRPLHTEMQCLMRLNS